MNVYVTQGHERGIGLEVFLKSCILFSPAQLKKLTLLAYGSSTIATLKSMQVPYELSKNSIQIAGIEFSVQWIQHKGHSESFVALDLGMKLAETGGVLFTLPTSKDQFPGFNGHTEYLRSFYRRPELGMFFSSPAMQALLLSDHIPLANVTQILSKDLIYGRLKCALKTLMAWQWPIAQVMVAGFNPHAGEKGLIGHEDERIVEVLKLLAPQQPFPMSGPYPGDTMLLEQRSPQDLLVYLYHDQGLGVFKGKQGLIGSNITLGLPYPRLGPDHGTSFQLYGKNIADYRGCAFSLKEALALLERTSSGKNPDN